MEKGAKMKSLIKKIIALALVLILSIKSFAAIVSDNDGSAFVTKSEFEAMKKDFAEQVINYNDSLDAKIDGAIAAYLAGIQLSTKETVKTYVENYKDLYWCHDFSIEAKEKKWTSRTASTIADERTLQPDYTNQNGWAYWRKDRGVRFQVIYPTNFGLAGFACRAAFLSDGTYTKTTIQSAESVPDKTSNILMLKVVGDSVIDTTPLINYYETQYNMIRWGLDWQSSFSMNLTNSTYNGNNITIEGIAPETSDEYFSIKATSTTGTTYWHRQRWTMSNTYAFSPMCIAFGTVEPGRNKTELEATTLTFPQYSYFCSSNDRVNENQTRIYNMMLGTTSSYRLPYLYDYKFGGPNGQVTSGYSGSTEYSNYSFADYSKWAKRSITTTLTLSPIAGVAGDRVDQNFTMNPVMSSASLTINIPVVTRGYVKDLRSPVATYNGENLKVCGGIPVLIEAQKTGKLTVKLKSEKKYDNGSKGAVGNTNAHIKFKKTDCTDTLDNYLSGTYGTTGTLAKFDGSQTINISNQTFVLDVAKGESVWMNIDPITLGQHIRITDLQCAYEYE